MAATRSAAAQKSSNRAGIWVGVVTVAVVGVCVAAGIVNDDGGTEVPPPATTERADTVAVLQRNATAQGLCYGWKLQDLGYDEVSVGSNLGDGAPVEGDPGCPRWIQVVADVRYTSESSESEDSALVRVTGSDDIPQSALWQIDAALPRFGLTPDVFVEDPGWAVTRAAVTLPLLAVEAELVAPAATPAAVPAAAPATLPDAGSDFWRDRWAPTLTAAGLLLVTALLVTVGLVQRHRQRRARR
ncbi:hypothetical protein O7606_18390 [Micromonospora sp. WMMD882]|uniref:hypothetical protein n=1 Tax=Micromonospora sp. WMMD882 TaxID=3015151 RepID=UPI00248AAFE2|nr:hypothetical protein [Micromonospora sp. WMMD882]WBB78197.1 hypothetical protein O7606_18390 [Micromonospora sp. WMMD882]